MLDMGALESDNRRGGAMTKKVYCVICEIEKARQAYGAGLITDEEFVKFEEQAKWEMKKAQYKLRIVCSQKCYDELEEILGIKGKDDKCMRDKCLHTRKMHMHVCTAYRCKCTGFLGEEEYQQYVEEKLKQERAMAELMKGHKF